MKVPLFPKISFIAYLVTVCGLLGPAFSAQARAYEIAILKSADIAAYNEAVNGFKAGMPNSTTFSEYDLQGDVGKGRKIAKKLRASDVSLVLAVGLKAALAAKLEILDIPVVFCMVLNPDKYDLKAPNLTGVMLEVPIERQLSTIRAILPRAKPVGVLYDPEKTGPLVEEARRLAVKFGLEMVERQVRSEKDVPTALRELLLKVDALWLIPDSTVLTEDSFRFLLGTALDHNIPVFGFSEEFVRSGAMASLSVSYRDVGKQTGGLASKILTDRTSFPSNPIPPEKIRMALNLKTAKFLGITIPPYVVSSADEKY